MNSTLVPVPRWWVLDANVLFSDWALCLMANLAVLTESRLAWTPTIEDECFRNLVRLDRLSPEDAKSLRAKLAELHGATLLPAPSEIYRADVKMVDPKDWHVAASALELVHSTQGNVALVTWNQKDFPKRPLSRLRISRYSPDELLLDLARQHSESLHQGDWLKNQCEQALLRIRAKFQSCGVPSLVQRNYRPDPTTADEWYDFLGRNRMFRCRQLIRK